jgi:MtN3 and saliva related transmembrane protein
MNIADTIGYLAASLTTASFLPQALRIWRNRETHAISLVMYAVFSCGVALWLLYGALVGSWPVLLANAVTLVLAVAILVMKIRYDRS